MRSGSSNQTLETYETHELSDPFFPPADAADPSSRRPGARSPVIDPSLTSLVTMARYRPGVADMPPPSLTSTITFVLPRIAVLIGALLFVRYLNSVQ